MTIAYAGRGAWPYTGKGGTLKLDSATRMTKPGPYYMLATSSSLLVGLAAARSLKAGQIPDLNEYAVNLGVKAIQNRLNAVGAVGADGKSLTADGVFGRNTSSAAQLFQARTLVLTPDGIVGAATSKVLFHPVIDETAAALSVPQNILCGTLSFESLLDPGAVGGVDAEDLGLGQINGPAHPSMTVEDRFDPLLAIRFVAALIKSNMDAFPNNIDDAVAAYNLGQGGCRLWIAAGRPQWWTPAGATAMRDVLHYINAIKTAC